MYYKAEEFETGRWHATTTEFGRTLHGDIASKHLTARGAFVQFELNCFPS